MDDKTQSKERPRGSSMVVSGFFLARTAQGCFWYSIVWKHKLPRLLADSIFVV